MAIDFNKIQNPQITSTQTVQSPESGSTSISKTPISLTNSNIQEINQNTELINYVNSAEFKNLSPEEQTTQLKERFFPNATNEEIQQYVTVAKQAAATAAGKTKTSETPVESSASENTNPGVESSNTKASQVKLTELEVAIDKAGLKGDIDEVKAKLLNLEKNGSITEEQLKILEELRKNETDSAVKVKSDNTSSKDSDWLIPMNVLFDEKFRNKSNEQKLDILTDAYLEKTDENYKNLSNADKVDKQDQLTKQIFSILKSVPKDGEKPAVKDKFVAARLLLSASKSTGKSLDEIAKDPASIPNLLKTEMKNQFTEILKVLPADKLKGKSSEEKVETYVDYFLSMNDEKYNSLQGAEKKAYLKDKFDDFIENNLGLRNWKHLPKEQKDTLYKHGTSIICALVQSGKSLDDFAKLSEAKKVNMLINILEEEDPVANEGYIKELKAKANIISILQDSGIENPTGRDIHAKLIELSKKGELTKEQKSLLAVCEAEHAMAIDNDPDAARVGSNRLRAKMIDGDVKTLFETSLQDLNKNNVSEYRKTIKSLVWGAVADNDIRQVDTLRAILKSKGFSDKEINSLIPAKVYNHLQARSMVNNDGVATAKAISASMTFGDDKVKEATAKGTGLSAKYLKDDNLEVVGETAAQYEQLIDPFTESINNRQYISKEAAANISASILQSENVPNANKALYTKEFISNAAQNGPEEQLYFGKELSKIDNAAVTEGLAAASNSVDSSVRNQYNSYVETAAKNYPPEQQAAIKTAMKTGEISQETMSQNTVSTSVENRNSETNSTRTNVSSTSSNSSRTSTPKTGVSAKTNSTNVPSAASSVASNKTSQSSKTSTTQNVQAQQEFRLMEQKKEALMDKIVSYELEKAEKMKDAEVKKVNQTQESKKTQVSDNESVPSAEAKDNGTSTSATTSTEEVAELELTKDEQAVLRAVITDIFIQNSVSAAYDKLIDKFGENGKDKFIEIFASKGKESDILSFAQNYKGNSETIVKLINYSKSDSLKLELVRLLPSNKVSELITSGKLSTKDIAKLVKENKVTPEVFLDYLKNNKGAMSPEQIKEYLKDMPLAYRGEFMALLRNIPGSDEWLAAKQQNMKTNVTSEPEVTESDRALQNELPTLEDGLPVGSSKVPMRGQYDKLKRKGPFYLKA